MKNNTHGLEEFYLLVFEFVGGWIFIEVNDKLKVVMLLVLVDQSYL